MLYDNKKIKAIEFGLLNPTEIRAKSVVEIKVQDFYEKSSSSSKPKKNGLFDTRMGPFDKYSTCKTCYNDISKCPGHIGHIELIVPVFYPHFMNNLKKILNSICHTCSRVLIGDEDKEAIKLISQKKKQNKISFTEKRINKSQKENICPHCNRSQFKIMKEGAKFFRKLDSVKTLFTAREIHKILKHMVDVDIELLGMSPKFSRPEWLLATVLIVPPPCIRPSINFGGNARCEDDLTHKLNEIIKANMMLREKMKTADEDKYIEYLQYHVFTYIDNNMTSVSSITNKSGRPYKTLKERFIGKDGIIRQNVTGKRVNYSARSVVSPEPLIDIDQVGVPLKICQKLTYPETVNRWNIVKLQKLVDAGPDNYPGAHFIKTGSRSIDLSFAKSRVMIKIGDVVERHLLADDKVVFNRQPSLHKASMQCHRVKPIYGNSFRLNPNVCAPYNCDFDGDEMNMHLARSIHTTIEIDQIASVPTQIISPQANKPLIGFIMDNVIGPFKMTQDDKLLKKHEVYSVIASLKDFDGEIPKPVKVVDGVEYWSGKQIMSLAIPNINYKSSGDTDVVIRNGVLESGVLTKKQVGATSGGLIHMITNDLGEKETVKYMNNAQRVINFWLRQEGFSVGFDDVFVNKDSEKEISVIVNEVKTKVDKFISFALEKNIKISKDDFEKKIFSMLNKARDDAGAIAMNNLDTSNSLYSMIKAGSKGNFINISQIMSCVGQQNVQTGAKSGRIGFLYHQRTLPHFQKYDSSAAAKGFVSNSYINGLNPTEFFFHTCAGREGLIDTAVKTSETGYIQRKLMKNMEDLRVQYDMTVRNEVGNIIQFGYGSDCFNAKYVEKQYFEIILMSNQDFKDTYQWESNKTHTKELAKEFSALTNIRKTYRKRKYYNNDLYAPINVSRILTQSRDVFEAKSYTPTELTLDYYFDTMKTLMKDIYTNREQVTVIKKINENNTRIIKAIILSKLSSKIVFNKFNCSKEQFDWIIEKIYIKFYKALIHPGENVGAIAAQSISEPTTQLSIDYEQYVILKINNKIRIRKIGEFVDKIINKNPRKEILLDITNEGKSSILNISEYEKIQVPSVSVEGKIEWKPLTQVSRHPPGGAMIKVKTKSGKEIISTMSHTFLTTSQDSKKIVSIRGDQLKIGTKIPLIQNFESNKRKFESIPNRLLIDTIRDNQHLTGMDREKLDMILDYVSKTGDYMLLEKFRID